MLSRLNRFPENMHENRIMIFIDGENLAKRYKNMLGNDKPHTHVNYSPDVYVWSHFLNFNPGRDIVRKYYYTSIVACPDDITKTVEELKKIGIEAPRVFKRTNTRPAKQVDISLSVDMLTHAHRKNYDVAVLVAGDEDYVPLVEAVMAEGRRVCLWFVEDGLSPLLKNRVDFYYSLEHILLTENPQGQ